MNTPRPLIRKLAPARIVLIAALGVIHARAADRTWTGAGPDRFWGTAANWTGGLAPAAGDSLFFGGTTHTTTTNNFAADTVFDDITFTSPAGFFTLAGNEIALGGNVTNNQVVTEQTISLPLRVGATPLVDIVPDGVLTLSGVVSGGGGLTTVDGGLLNLSGANTFTGPLTIDGGTVAVGADNNLGAGNLALDGGRLETTASFALSSSRGIAVGPGWGGIRVDPGTTLSYGGVIADNGGAGDFVKNGYGTLVLSGQNTYTGATSNRVGTLTLDFTQPTSPVNNIIPSGSDLTLGGENAGLGGENEAELNVLGQAGTANAQTFNGTHLTFAGSVIRATSGSGGAVNLNLGTLSHDPGGTLVMIPPAAGSFTTAPGANVNGILGGFATIGNGSAYTANGYTVLFGTNYATVDAGGNIVNFTSYLLYASGNLAGQVTVSTNLLFQPSSPSVITVDNDNAGTTTTVNAIKIMAPETGTTAHYYGIYIGPGNTLRLGQYGGILKNDFSEDVITIGGVNGAVQSGSGTTGSGDIGAITAGGADNTPGEIVMDANAHDETHGTTIFEATIADNGTGPVTFVKTGPGSIKLDGHNTFSGGLYLLQGRVQFAGSEIGNANPDGGGTGPIYILPGSYLFPSGTGGGAITNAIFVAGSGDAAEPLGAFRGGLYAGPVTLIGDATFGGGATFDSPIQGPFNVTLGSPGTINGGATLNSPSNDWSGNTFLTARTRNGGGNNTITCGTNNVIPHGFGKGNVTLIGGGSGTVTWDLNGFNQTINGLSTSGISANTLVVNGSAATSATLALGDNNQSGTFGGMIEDFAGQVALTKIGGGIETLTGANTYSGLTAVNGGTLALSGSGSIASSTNIQVNPGGTLDVSGVTSGFSTPYPLQLSGGTLVGNATVGGLSASDGALTLDINPQTVNVTATALTTGGASNVINVASVSGVPGYPARFTIIQYSGSLTGADNFVIGSVPNSKTGGYVSNDVAGSRIILVLTNGPASLTWVGNDPVHPTYWDDVTTNWLAFKGSPNQTSSTFEQADSAFFDDTALATTIDLRTNLQPGFVTVSNNTLDFTFTGGGALSGSQMSLVKDGSATLTLLNTGGDSYSRGVTVNGGTLVFGSDNAITGGVIITNATVQVGTNGGAGTLPAGNVDDEGSLVFNRGANLTVPNAISGAGAMTEMDANVLTLSGDNSGFVGSITALTGTLKAGSGTALGIGTNTINSGATLDVNGQSLLNVPVIVSGAGVGGQGAIVNSGADNINALGNVTLAGNTTFGGTGRWDIRVGGPQAQLLTSGNAYSLTKTGPNFISLAGLYVDPALGDINVQQGTLEINGITTLGDSAHTLTVSPGATLQVYGAGSLGKQFVLNGTGTNTTLNCVNGTGNSIAGPVTLNGACLFSSGTGDTLSFSATLSGSGSMTQTGAGTNIIAGGASATYTGGTTLSNGTLAVDGTLSGTVYVAGGATLAGMGTAGGGVTVQSGALSPGDIAVTPQATLTVGTLALSNATAIFELSSSTGFGNDQLVDSGALTLSGTNTLEIVPLSFMNVGDTYTLMTYNGTLPSSATNNLKVVASKPYFTFALLDPSTTPGAIEVTVLTAVGNDAWTGASSSTWDTASLNWTRNGNPVAFNAGDVVTFDDTSTVTNVNLSGTLPVSGIIEQSYSENYTFGGTGSLSGPGGLDFEGISLTIANSGTNTFAGPVNIASGILQLGNGGAHGNLGSGLITNNGALVFNRSDNALTLSNTITGGGSLTNIGGGTVTLAGANSFVGNVNVMQGTLRTLNSAALSDTTGLNGSSTYVNAGATLDIGANTVEWGNEPLFVSGAGVGGNGAIINSSGSTAYGGGGGNFYNLTLLGDTAIGGTGRIDMRNTTATPTLYMSPIGTPYTLTKVGPNLFQMVNVQVDPGLGNINVEGGTLGIQGTMSLGNTESNLTVFNGATFDMYSVVGGLDKVVVLQDGGTFASTHDNNELDGPVTLQGGTNIFDVSTASLNVANVVSGPGNLQKTGGGTLILSNTPEAYTGNTLVNGGTLALVGDATIAGSPALLLGGGTVDVSGRTDGTLTLSGQVLAGNGGITGSLVENSGSVVTPGNGLTTAKLSVSGAATLNGAVLMDLNRTNALKSDQLVAGGITAGGMLTVTNLGPDLVSGDTFQLFSLPVSGFATINLPTNNAAGNVTYQWENDLATAGSITLTNVIGGVSTVPTNIVFSVSNGNLTLSWPTNHIGWTLQAQTNTLAAGLGTNWVDMPNSTTVNSMTVPIGTTNGAVFYRLVYKP